MDVAYQQHSSHSRRKNRSTTNLNHLSLAPLTSKLPLRDPEDLPESVTNPAEFNGSYIQRKSAPTTPRLLTSPSPARATSRSRRSSFTGSKPDSIPKSKSSSHLAGTTAGKHNGIGSLSSSKRRRKDDLGPLSANDRNDSDWMLRTGALISTETREYKGQSWLVSRESSTSLTGLRDTEEEAYERELARERDLVSRHESRRGSLAGDENVNSPVSRYGSRSHSRVGSRTMLRTPGDRHAEEGYFKQEIAVSEEYTQGPDFVSLDEKLEAVFEVDASQADEATIRRLVKRENLGAGSWMGSLIGWSLFSVEENEEEVSDNADGEQTDGEADEASLRRSASSVHFDGLSAAAEPQMPLPDADQGGWSDAAWLLSVASKVML